VIQLLDVGIFGYLLYTGFFVLICSTALRRLREATLEMKVLSVGVVSAFLGIWIHNMADPFGGHALQAMWWLYAGLIFAISHALPSGKSVAVNRSKVDASGRAGSGGLVPDPVLVGRAPGTRAARLDELGSYRGSARPCFPAVRADRDQTKPA
jgi:hypothetical protein